MKANSVHDVLIKTIRALKEMNLVADIEKTESLYTTSLGHAAYKGLSLMTVMQKIIMSPIFFL